MLQEENVNEVGIIFTQFCLDNELYKLITPFKIKCYIKPHGKTQSLKPNKKIHSSQILDGRRLNSDDIRCDHNLVLCLIMQYSKKILTKN